MATEPVQYHNSILIPHRDGRAIRGEVTVFDASDPKQRADQVMKREATLRERHAGDDEPIQVTVIRVRSDTPLRFPPHGQLTHQRVQDWLDTYLQRAGAPGEPNRVP